MADAGAPPGVSEMTSRVARLLRGTAGGASGQEQGQEQADPGHEGHV